MDIIERGIISGTARGGGQRGQGIPIYGSAEEYQRSALGVTKKARGTLRVEGRGILRGEEGKVSKDGSAEEDQLTALEDGSA